MSALDRYREMRDFSSTPEPSGVVVPAGLAPRYGMQLHDATRKHFDLRLEWNGILLSWAVTRGPSLQRGEKRLAVRTEDHPLDYLDFEGTIPKGNYGAGTVMLWDIGHWQPIGPVGAALTKGHLRFHLYGQRLTGAWHLVRMAGKEKRENWLLLKQDDEAAGRRDPVARYRRSVATNRTLREIASEASAVPIERKGTRPRFRKPQLATLSSELAEGAGWWHELKFDGYRALVALGRGGTRIFTRNGLNWTEKFRSLTPGFDAVDCDSALIDSEIVAGAGLQGFAQLQKAIKVGGPFTCHAFDLLDLNGASLLDAPLSKRRKRLEDIFRDVPPLGPLQLSPLIEGDAAGAFAAVCDAGGEGLIAKRIKATYRGVRTSDWLKIKCRQRSEFVILGWKASDKRTRPFASLALGAYRPDGLVYSGQVGTGFDDVQMGDLEAAMKPLTRRTAPANVPDSESRGMHWIAPKLVAEIEYAEVTPGGRLRHPVFKGLREDKPARSVRLEGDTVRDNAITVRGISISSPERIVDSETGFRKEDIARYYDAVADRMLKTCADRPLSLVRLPEGLTGERFFQKHAGPGFPNEIKAVKIKESGGKTAPYMYVSSGAGLVAGAQMGTFEYHIWGSRRDNLERPDRMVFDLDPDDGLPWAEVASAAADLRDRLNDLGIPCWPLVSGGKGVHLVVPLRRIAEWDTVKLYARVFATLVETAEPKRFTATMSKSRRTGRIFIDWLRNERGATAIAPFSLRARKGVPVAVPVGWDELSGLNTSQAFSASAALERSWSEVPIPKAVGLGSALVARLEAASKTSG